MRGQNEIDVVKLGYVFKECKSGFGGLIGVCSGKQLIENGEMSFFFVTFNHINDFFASA